jgi:2'-5' RNA ligase
MTPVETNLSAQPDCLRLFLAIAVPETVKEKIHEVQRALQKLLAKAAVRWTPPEQIHLTLRFFGSVETKHLPQLQAAVANGCTGSPQLQLQACGLGVFPPKRAPRVVWVGVTDRANQLATLQKILATATADFGEPPEPRDFSAHLTLGRIKEIRRSEESALRAFIANQQNPACGEWTVTEVSLFQSQLGASGAKHSVISQYALAQS